MSWEVRVFQYQGQTGRLGCSRHRHLGSCHTSWPLTACSIILRDPHPHKDLVDKWLSQ